MSGASCLVAWPVQWLRTMAGVSLCKYSGIDRAFRLSWISARDHRVPLGLPQNTGALHFLAKLCRAGAVGTFRLKALLG